MKRIAVVDDRPWKLKECIRDFKRTGVPFYKTVYYPNNTLDKKYQEKLMKQYQESTGLETVRVNSQKEFLDTMNELYETPDVIFLMDYDLKGDMGSYDFFTRINIKYAREKNKENKIWFYTTGPADVKRMLSDTFPGHVISIPDSGDGQLYWNPAEVREAAGIGRKVDKPIPLA